MVGVVAGEIGCTRPISFLRGGGRFGWVRVLLKRKGKGGVEGYTVGTGIVAVD